MEVVTSDALERFLQKLGERIAIPSRIYLYGGSALCLLGSPRETLDVYYSLEPEAQEVEKAVESLAAELKMDIEAVPLAEFIPLPPEAQQRRRFVGRYGQLEAYIFDLYSIALSKIARGFEADLVEVVFAGLSRCVNVVSVKVFPGGPLGLSFDSLLQINIGPGAEISACEMLSCSR